MSQPFVAVRHGAVMIELMPPAAHASSVKELAYTFRANALEAFSAIELHASFIQHCVNCGSSKVALAVFDTFRQTYNTATNDIHMVVQAHGLDEAAARRVLKGYFSAWPIVNSHIIPSFIGVDTRLPALFTAEYTGLMAMFGGQRGTSSYLDEAEWLLDAYRPLLFDFVSRMSAFLHRESQDNRVSLVYSKGLDVFCWLTTANTMPDNLYLLSIPVCLPLVALIQLMHVMVLYKTLGVSPGELTRHFKVAVGHSQGIGIAAAFSTLTDEQSFYSVSERILGIHMLAGAFPQIKYPCHRLNALTAKNYSHISDGEPRPMVSVQGITKPVLEQLISKFNIRQLSPAEHAFLAVANTVNHFIVASEISSAAKLVEFLRSESADPDQDQSRIPYPLRKPVIIAQYTTITAPYHCPLLEPAADEACAMSVEKGWVFHASDMQIPVRASDDGHDIRTESDLTRYLFSAICVLLVDWPQATQCPGVTHIVDFGPGGLSGFGLIAYKNIEGMGIPVVCAGALVSRSSKPYLGSKADLYKTDLASVTTVLNWLAEFGPKLVRTAHDGQLHVDTPMSRVLGAPTVMVAGMGPTTANEKFVAAINNAGYHVELGGGGIFTEEDLERKIDNLVKLAKPGQGITLNCIYINQRMWSFQFPALLRLRAKGVPVAGLCIGGGVPSLDSAASIIDSLRSVGIRHVAFKPSTTGAIRDVVNIAKAHAGFPVVLQWTGGRAGGHHSFEDFHQPILETYAAIRACRNIVLIAGSGFGDAEGSLPYLTGDWSTLLGRAPMPFDGILLASRVMVAKEAGTSLAAKELIVASPGLSDSKWQNTYDGPNGGVMTITSEYGELNHVLATRAMVFVDDLRTTVLSQPRERHATLLLARKDEIIARLNSDYFRPWFGRKTDGRVVDLEEMTYAEVISRLVELLYLKRQQRWIHESYHRVVLDFLARAERRLGMDLPEMSVMPELEEAPPAELVQSFTDRYSAAESQLLYSEDIQFFVGICKRRGQKPVPFIVALDADFATVLVKDSIWQSENLEAVVDHDPQRVVVQQGPVATRYSTIVNEPVKDILDGIYHGHIAALLSRDYDGDVANVPVVECIGAQPGAVTLPASINAQATDLMRMYQLPSAQDQLPDLGVWLDALAGPTNSWLRALLTSPVIVEGSSYVDNYIPRALRPRPGQVVTVLADGLQPQSLEIMDDSGTLVLKIERSSRCSIELNIYHSVASGTTSMCYLFVYHPEQPLTPIHFVTEGHGERMRKLCMDAWIDNADVPTDNSDLIDTNCRLYSDGFVITKEHVRAFCQNVGNRSKHYSQGIGGDIFAPMDFLVVSTLPNFMRALSSTAVTKDILKILHLYNKYQIVDGATMLKVGESVSSDLTITDLVNTPIGRRAKLLINLYRYSQKVATIESAFLYRDEFIDIDKTFEHALDQRFTIQLLTANDITVLLAKEWFVGCNNVSARLSPGSRVEFRLDSKYRFKSENVYSRILTTGRAFIKSRSGQLVHIADVHFACGVSTKDPVVEYLRRNQEPLDASLLFDHDGHPLVSPDNHSLLHVTVPDSNWEYAKLSADGNPIHTNPYMADILGLPGPVTHGLWTSASTRALVECYASDDEPERIRVYQARFVGMVLPRDELRTELFHIGMKCGRMLVKGVTSKVGGGPVLECTAEIEQPATAYVFTGQGSQEVGMGMELYKQSTAARDVWDRADRHMVDTYGISLLEIVRTNPKRLTVHFGGRRGEAIRRSYMLLSIRCSDKVSDCNAVPLFPEITLDSPSYTYRSPTGLLNSTQFTQAILITFAVAAIADMRTNSLVQKDAAFSGHSLGEYAALAALSGMFAFEDVLDVTFYRGLLMQSAVKRDVQGRSQYGMAAVDPSRLGHAVDESVLVATLATICEHSKGLLEVVNYNVRGSQYVVAGTLRQLAVLRLVLDGIATKCAPGDDDWQAHIAQIISNVLAKPVDSRPVRGRATIPLPGIDVPFHSSQLLPGVGEFRVLLKEKIRPENIDYSALHRRYVPNLTAVPFEVSRQYFSLIYNITMSPVAAGILDDWSESAMNNDDDIARLAATLLVELLAYQFASPVQWIDTQDVLLGRLGVRRVVEIGVSPVLSGIATKTLKSEAFAGKHIDILHIERDRDAIYYTQQRPEVIEPALSAMPAQLEQPTLPVTTVAVEPIAPVIQSSGTTAPLVDVPLQALDVVHALVTHKIKRSLADVSMAKSIKSLVSGKSTLQNEIVGDLHKEFGSKVPDKAEDLSLQDLATAIGAFGGGLGKHTQAQLARLFSNKMPGGFSLSSARSILQSVYGLGPQRQDTLLLSALTMEPSSRLSNDAEAKSWLGTVAQAYATMAGISYAVTSAGGSSSQTGAPVISSAEMEKMQQKQHEHIRQQIQVLARYAGMDLREGACLAEDEQAKAAKMQTKLDKISAEFGDEFIDGAQPLFDTRKARRFDSSWNWVRQEAYELIQQAIAGCAAGSTNAPACVDEAALQRLKNRSSPGLLQMLAGSLSILQVANDDSLEPVIRLVSEVYDSCTQSLTQPPVYREQSTPTGPHFDIGPDGTVTYSEVPRLDEPSFVDFVQHMRQPAAQDKPPFIHLKKQLGDYDWSYCVKLSTMYYEGLSEISGGGLSFASKTALVAGCGRGSIGADIVCGLLSGGAKVIATTSSYSRKTTLFFEDMYRTHGARGSELVVVPFNQGSTGDVKQLVDYIYSDSGAAKGLNWDLDYVFPFAAVSDIGSFATNLGSRSELAQRVLLTNVMRLLGSIKDTKERLGYVTRPSLVVLPLSPNHGNFGGDGLYGECKLGLETTFNRWESESWQDYLSIAGAVIGWTRGTGLMSGNNVVAQEVERIGVRTFSTREIAFSILGLAHSRICRIAYNQPIWADLSGGLNIIKHIGRVVSKAKTDIEQKSALLQLIARENALDYGSMSRLSWSTNNLDFAASPLARHKYDFPAPRQFDQLQHLRHLQGMVNLDKVVVITGYGEIGPYGSASTRWEMEAHGKFSLEGCIELAWIMGLVKHSNGPLKTTSAMYVGWVDAKTEEPIRDVDVKARYEEYILAHTGIRLIEPESTGGYDPNTRKLLREIQIEHDMEPFEATAEEAAAFKAQNGSNVDIWENSGRSSWSVKFLRGALIRVPMASRASRLSAGLLPTGWDPRRYGIPEAVVKQVDIVVCYALVVTIEALVRSGITDPYELYKYFHVSEVGNTMGSGIGGSRAIQDIFRRRHLDKEVKSDAIQESFISTVQAWVNMLLMSGSGPVKPVVGACATAVLSIDTAIETIQSGKAEFMIAGGVEDFIHESSVEFAHMGATSNSIDETAQGRTPSEMCRPCTTTRNGFTEAQGAGVVTLMSASAALRIGAPIYGIMAMSGTATDKQGQSVPAPGKGVLTSAREVSGGGVPSRMLNFDYRRRQLQRQLAALDVWKQAEFDELTDATTDVVGNVDLHVLDSARQIEKEYLHQRHSLQDVWGNEFWRKDTAISPLRGSLAVWGLTADDIGVASFHGTSTVANDKNESDIFNSQLAHLGRTPGHVVPVMCQKWLTGHSKGAAASFMVNGALQTMRTGLIPGNRNADNIAKELEAYDYALYLSKSVQTMGIKSCLLKSFGFGQVGGEVLLVHSDYLFATLTQEQLEKYNVRLQRREPKAHRYLQDTLVGNHAFVQVKSSPPYTAEQEKSVYLNPLARAKYDPATKSYKF
ncbi:fatty acid synthase alpha subunit Lsd1 [Coemansia aciculifera]|uniref:Fatty acid synthase alpha subunit Lsd1 n=1 Tax=Coemansia aciculifera TaxID=417176 RepID=A0A9W8M6V2_9FUNG|nr:fatty acid synthase alpha subunit Lsd1 [Coemansia aciculifera]